MAFRCSSCSAALDPSWAQGPLVTCRYCRVAQSSPFRSANVLLELDPSQAHPAGFSNRLARPAVGPDGRPELLVDAEPLGRALQPSLVSAATFDDFEARLSVRLLYGDVTTTSVGLFFRRTATNFYTVQLSTVASLRVLRWVGEHMVTLQPWMHAASARTEPGAVNELTLRAEGDRLSVRVNGTHTCVVRDGTHRAGTLSVMSQAAVRHAYAVAGLVVEGVAGPPAPSPPIATAGPHGHREVRSGALVFRHASAGQGVAVTLAEIGTSKIMVIKAIREPTGWGLAEAKNASERLPSLIGHAADAVEAARWVAHLEAAGARARRG